MNCNMCDFVDFYLLVFIFCADVNLEFMLFQFGDYFGGDGRSGVIL